jgi:excisionase family DNA binding protein
MSDNLLTTNELAEKLGVSKMTIYHWRSRLGLPSYKRGNVCLYELDDVVAFLKGNSQVRIKIITL